MSYLTPPRITFIGNSYANASTANNNDIASVYDIDKMQLNPQMNLMDGGTSIQPPPPGGNTFNWNGAADNPALRNWLMGLMEAPGLNEDPDPVTQEGRGQMGHWNYYGDHNAEFRETYINNFMTTKGPALASDPASRLQVELLGDVFYQTRRGAVLVDVDPYALITSQIFSGQLRLSLKLDKQLKIPVLLADHPTPAYSYFINPHKNLNPSCTGFESVSAVFQFGLPIDNMTFYEGKDFVSLAFDELKQKAQAGGGLMVRFCLYDAIFEIQADELAGDFAQGKYVFNPYVGRVLGTIGVWNEGELASAPPGRKLRVQVPYTYTPPPPDVPPEELALKKRRMATVPKYRARRKSNLKDDSQKSATLGITLANVDTTNSVVSLDCISTFPEANIKNRDKFDLGPMNLVLLYGTPPAPDGLPPNSVTIGPVPYDKATYESGGGMVDISYADNPDLATINANIATGRLALYRTATQTNQLIETPNTDTQTDNRAVYFDAKIKQNGQVTPGRSQFKSSTWAQLRPPPRR